MRRSDTGERPGRRGELARWYAEVLADQAASDLSVSAYADEIGVTASTLYQWRRRLGGQGDSERRTRRSFGLVEIGIQEEPARDRTGGLLVRLGGDRCIEVPRRFDDGAIGRLIRGHSRAKAHGLWRCAQSVPFRRVDVSSRAREWVRRRAAQGRVGDVPRRWVVARRVGRGVRGCGG